jgi:hypothetical protein
MSKKSPKDHYVQQAFYQNFTIDSEKQHINVFDKISQTIRLNQPIRDISSEPGFFHVNFEEYKNWIIQNKIQVEKEKFDYVIKNLLPNFIDFINSNFFEPLLDSLQIIIQQLDTNEKGYISFINSEEFETTKRSLSTYLVLQYLKTRSSKEKIMQYINNREFIDIPKISIDDEITKLIHAKTFFEPKSTEILISNIFKCYWVLGFSNPPNQFFTSDNPIIVESNNPFDDKIFPDDFRIFYPISPNLVLIVFSTYAHFPLIHSPFRNSFINIPERYIHEINAKQLSNARRIIGFSDVQTIEQINKLQNLQKE